MWNRSTISRTLSVGIKRLLDDFRVTAAQVRVTAAQVRVTAAKHGLLMLLVQKLLLLELKVNVAGISYYCLKITTAERVYADRGYTELNLNEYTPDLDRNLDDAESEWKWICRMRLLDDIGVTVAKLMMLVYKLLLVVKS
ncbi:hypothetical protein Tco_1111700 [Tanacetum coccineum]|uniref:Uncharacterized protein n=1 Tax=Tanacetum coccineum TaxID=301880 RepID=A0ABQ5IMF0_9ASTR